MTHKGCLTPISKKGLNKADFSPIRATIINKNVGSFLKAGRFALNDKLKGISENILVGNLTNIGTGCFYLLMDINN